MLHRLVPALVLLALSVPALAQPPSARTGLVVDGAGLPVADALVLLVSPEGEASPYARTAADGRFPLPTADADGIRLRVERQPFTPATVALPPPSARPAGATDLRIVLDLSIAAETVTVAAPLVDATTVDSFGSVTTTVSDTQVRDLHALDLASALRRTPGVTISRLNPVGVFGGGDGGAVFVRGTGASRPGSEIATTIDGIPFYMGIWGHPLLGLLPVSSAEQITVRKGPQPHGLANAFASVDIETRRARTEGMTFEGRISGGAFSTLAQQADVTLRRGAWDIAGAQGFARSDGHRPDADGRMFSSHARGTYRLNDAWALGGTALHVRSVGSDPGELGRPDTKTGRYESTGTLLAGTIRHVEGRLAGTLDLYRNSGTGDWFNQPAPDGDTLADFRTVGLRWRGQLTPWRGGRVTGAVDVDSVSGDVRFERVPPAPTSTFAADRLTLASPALAVDHGLSLGGAWSLTPSVGLRVYRHSVFDAEVAPHAGLVARRGSVATLHLSYARGVNYPGQEVVALSSLIPPLGATWRDLAAERMDHVEGGLSLAPSSTTSVDVTAFSDRVANRYVFGFPPALARPSFVNLGGYRIRGAELSVRQALGADWQVFGGATLLDPTLETLPYAPARALVAGVTGRHGPLRVSVDLQAQSRMHVLAAARNPGAVNTQRVDGFAVVNVRPSWRLPRFDGRAEIFAAIENLFDEGYAYRPGYPMPGVSAQVGVSLRARRP